MTKEIRFYYNGIKVNGGKLVRCFYFTDRETGTIIISARDYDHLPRDLFPVHNDTDLYTDYFDSDNATIGPAHPLHKYAAFAAYKSTLHDLEHSKKFYEKRAEQRAANPRSAEMYRNMAQEAAAKIAALEPMKDPGQPTAADLAKIHQANQEAESARIAKEHEEELKRREIVLAARNEGRAYIERIAAENPIVEGAPVVTIQWSEHPAFYSWDDNALKISIAAADIILSRYDREAAADDEHGYYKTSFLIEYTTEDGDAGRYDGRYDLGDNDGGLVAHIRNWGGSYINPEEKQEREELADYFQGFTASGRVVSVTVAPCVEQYAAQKKAQAEREANEIFELVQVLTDDQLAEDEDEEDEDEAGEIEEG